MKMKTKILLFFAGIMVFVSCSEDFITKDLDKSSYDPGSYFTTKARAEQALVGAYTYLRQEYGSTWGGTIVMHNVLGDDLYETPKAAGFLPWGNISNFYINANDVNGTWNAWYAAIQRANTALDNMKLAKEIDPNFTQEELNVMEGQAYFLRAYFYYILFDYFPKNIIVLRNTQVLTPGEEFIKAPSTKEETFAFIEADLKRAQELLVNGTNTSPGYGKWRASRGAATALLGKLYLNNKDYVKAAAEFKKILPGVGDPAYGTYTLGDYRANFTNEGENNSESIFEVQLTDVTTPSNQRGGAVQNWSFNDHNAWAAMVGWNFAVPTYKLDDFERWTEIIDGQSTTVYDYRVYATFLGVPNGINLTLKGRTVDWIDQGWYWVDGVDYTGRKTGNGADFLNENGERIATMYKIGGLDSYGSFGIRKRSHESDVGLPGNNATSTVINLRLLRLSDIMLNYAECLANINPSNLSAVDVNSGVYWVDLVRDRANNVMTGDQSHLYSARPGVRGQLPPVLTLMTQKGWTLMQAIEHERYVEGYGEGWRREDLKRWEKGADFVKGKPGYTGWQSLILPVPQQELDRNPLMPRP
jgi:tetratricopeptide (TPR) repeat protein